MRLVVLALVAACSSAPTCKEAVTTAAKRFDTAERSEVMTLIGSCEQHNWRADVRTCFTEAKTSEALVDCLSVPKIPLPVIEPSKSVKAVLAAAPGEPIRALLFFPPQNDVATIVDAYFKATSIVVEHHDRFVEPDLAAKYKLTRDGVVVVRGTQSRLIEVDAELEKARRVQLRSFDREVDAALRRITRARRKVYLVAGHGEITDRDSIPPELRARIPERRTTMLAQRLGELSYEVASLPVVTLLADVPADATAVLLLAPTVPLAAAEWESLARYLDRGGALLVALDPTGDPSLGSLGGKLALAFDPAHLIDDSSFLPQRGSAVDHRLILTSQFSSHASTAGLSRAISKGLVLVDSGSLVPAPAQGPAPKQTFTIQTMPTTFRDLDQNFTFSANEHRDRYNVAAAVEGPKWRALVFADVDLFADVLVQGAGGHATVTLLSGPLLDDSMRWLAGDASFIPDPPGTSVPEPIEDASTLHDRELRDRERALVRAISHH